MRKVTTAATLTAMHKDDQQSVIWFLILENVPGGEIIMRMCIISGDEKNNDGSDTDSYAQG